MPASRAIDVYIGDQPAGDTAAPVLTLHRRFSTWRRDAPTTSVIRTLVTNLPLGRKITVRVVALSGRMSFEGFGLSRLVEPDDGAHDSGEWLRVFHDEFRVDDAGWAGELNRYECTWGTRVTASLLVGDNAHPTLSGRLDSDLDLQVNIGAFLDENWPNEAFAIEWVDVYVR